MIELGREGVWVPDYRFVHKATGTDVFVEVLGFWKTVEPRAPAPAPAPPSGRPGIVLAISDRLKVDEEAEGELRGPVLRFKEIPNAPELAALARDFRRTGGGVREAILGGPMSEECRTSPKRKRGCILNTNPAS